MPYEVDLASQNLCTHRMNFMTWTRFLESYRISGDGSEAPLFTQGSYYINLQQDAPGTSCFAHARKKVMGAKPQPFEDQHVRFKFLGHVSLGAAARTSWFAGLLLNPKVHNMKPNDGGIGSAMVGFYGMQNNATVSSSVAVFDMDMSWSSLRTAWYWYDYYSAYRTLTFQEQTTVFSWLDTTALEMEILYSTDQSGNYCMKMQFIANGVVFHSYSSIMKGPAYNFQNGFVPIIFINKESSGLSGPSMRIWDVEAICS